MRVIHGIWAHGALCLWAEDPDLPPTSAASHDVRLPRPHPFACQAADLAARGQVLPVLADEGETYAARWRPVLGGADAPRAHDLAAQTPDTRTATPQVREVQINLSLGLAAYRREEGR